MVLSSIAAGPSPAVASARTNRPPRIHRFSLVPDVRRGGAPGEYQVISIVQLPISGASHWCSGPGRLATLERASVSSMREVGEGVCAVVGGAAPALSWPSSAGSAAAIASSPTAHTHRRPDAFTLMLPPGPYRSTSVERGE